MVINGDKIWSNVTSRVKIYANRGGCQTLWEIHEKLSHHTRQIYIVKLTRHGLWVLPLQDFAACKHLQAKNAHAYFTLLSSRVERVDFVLGEPCQLSHFVLSLGIPCWFLHILTVHVLIVEALIKTATWGYIISYVRLRHAVLKCPCFPFGRTLTILVTLWYCFWIARLLHQTISGDACKWLEYQLPSEKPCVSMHLSLVGVDWLLLNRTFLLNKHQTKPLSNTFKAVQMKTVSKLLP